MCGIFGLWAGPDNNLTVQSILQMGEILYHRGPDDEGYLLAHTNKDCIIPCAGADTPPALSLPAAVAQNGAFNLALGFRRLAILDLSPAGHQPMVSADRRFWLVYNGEIYNYIELREELRQAGYTFHSGSDTEVLLAAYAHWGTVALNRLVGMFAFAIFDTHTRHLFLARDFFGIKPLYYTTWQGGIAFASEIKALLTLPEIKRQVNPQRLYDYLRFQVTDHGQETIFANIYQLPAAHYLQIPLDSPFQHLPPSKYWNINIDSTTDLSFTEATKHLKELFLNNVNLHLRSDVPVGAALSGGIDSSAIVMAMHYLKGDQLDLHTFSHVTHDPILGEEKWVDLVGQTSQAKVHKVIPSPDDLANDLDNLIRTQDEPFGSTSIYAQYRVFKLAQQAGIKVMLDGQGADELLGGYRPYIAARLASLVRRGQWVKAKSLLRQASALPGSSQWHFFLETVRLLLPSQLQDIGRRSVGRSLFPPWLNESWFIKNNVAKSFQANYGRDVLRDQLYRSINQISLPMLLRYEDRNSMAFSIESRVPFLTPKLVEFVFALPEDYIIAPDSTTKAIFREAMRGIVPDPILDRRDKIGFATPEREWLMTLTPWVEKILRSDAAKQVSALNLTAIEAEWQAIRQGQKPFDFRVWRWLNVIEWSRQNEITFDQQGT